MKVISRKNQLRKLCKDIKKAEMYFNNTKSESSFGIHGSTFRSYRGFKIAPSKIYSEWVVSIRNDSIIRNLQSVNSRKKFLNFHRELQGSLDAFWYKRQKKRLTIAQRNKIIDLFLKYLGRTQQCKNIITYGNVPLDKFSLLLVSDMFYGVVVSKKPSMGDIRDIETYDFLQDLIWKLTSREKIPNLYFDYFAWNSKH